jgi:hypothetical protein
VCWQRNTEWKQFSIVSKDDLVKLGINAQDNSIGLIISHSCDIANTNLQAEPTLELLIGTITNKKCDGSFSNGKNNRTLHVQLETAPLVCLEVKMTAKIAIEKTQIAELALIPAPNYEINETNQRIIKRWLTTRYDRAAFPDTFNDLMREHDINKKIKRFLDKNSSNEIIGLLLNYKEHLYDDHTQYELTILVLYSTIDDPQKNKLVAQTVSDQIKKIFTQSMPEENFTNKDCILLKNVLSVSDETLTYKQAQLFERWEPGDDLSMETGGEAISA